MGSLWYAHKYGLVDDKIYDLLWNTCEIRHPNLMLQQGEVHLAAAKLNQELLKLPEDERRRHATRKLAELQPTFLSPECRLAHHKFMMSASHGLSQSGGDLYIDDCSLFAPVSKLEDKQMTAYMSRSDVRKALLVGGAPTHLGPARVSDSITLKNTTFTPNSCRKSTRRGLITAIRILAYRMKGRDWPSNRFCSPKRIADRTGRGFTVKRRQVWNQFVGARYGRAIRRGIHGLRRGLIIRDLSWLRSHAAFNVKVLPSRLYGLFVQRVFTCTWCCFCLHAVGTV
jgi:hypothetical protein